MVVRILLSRKAKLWKDCGDDVFYLEACRMRVPFSCSVQHHSVSEGDSVGTQESVHALHPAWQQCGSPLCKADCISALAGDVAQLVSARQACQRP